MLTSEILSGKWLKVDPTPFCQCLKVFTVPCVKHGLSHDIPDEMITNTHALELLLVFINTLETCSLSDTCSLYSNTSTKTLEWCVMSTSEALEEVL